jgi:hypothetical protein
MYRIKLVCEGIPENMGSQAAVDITQEFASRPWQSHALCTWDGSLLLLELENDFDEKGLAATDEFSDTISACMSGGFDGDIKLVDISKA